MNKNSFTTMIAGAVLAASAAAAQGANTGNISGYVRDIDNKPLAGVQMMIVSSREVSKTDKDGKFSFVGEDPQTYTLQVSIARYTPASASAAVKPNATSAMTFTLTKLPSQGRVINGSRNLQLGGIHPVIPDILVYSPDAITAFPGDTGLHSTARSR